MPRRKVSFLFYFHQNFIVAIILTHFFILCLAAIAAEVKQQKATLAKQREEYVKKSATLQRELEILRQQCDEIGKEGGRENNRIIKENQKLQVYNHYTFYMKYVVEHFNSIS